METERPMLVLAEASPAVLVALAAAALVILVMMVVIGKYFNLWVQCYMTGAGIGFLDLVGMSLRKVDPRPIVTAKIMAVKGGVDVDTGRLEAHHVAGGSVENVVKALIAARRAGLPLDFARATAIDLSGEDVLDGVQQMARTRTKA